MRGESSKEWRARIAREGDLSGRLVRVHIGRLIPSKHDPLMNVIARVIEYPGHAKIIAGCWTGRRITLYDVCFDPLPPLFELAGVAVSLAPAGIEPSATALKGPCPDH